MPWSSCYERRSPILNCGWSTGYYEKVWFPEDLIDKLIALRWCDKPDNELKQMQFLFESEDEWRIMLPNWP